MKTKICNLLRWALTGYVIPLTIISTSASAADRVAATYSAPDATHPKGRLEIFIAHPVRNGGIYHTWETTDGPWQTPWLKYTPEPDDGMNTLAVETDDGGRIVVAWISERYLFVLSSCAAGASLHTPAQREETERWPLPLRPRFTQVAIGKNLKNRLELFALDTDGHLWVSPERNTYNGCPYFSGYSRIGELSFRNVSVTALGNGDLGVAALGRDGAIYAALESNGRWPQTWVTLEGNDIKDVFAHQSADHRLEVMVLGGDNSLYHKYQITGPSGSPPTALDWTTWEFRQKPPVKPPILFAADQNGRLELFFRGADETTRLRLLENGPNANWQSAPTVVSTPGQVDDETWTTDAAGALTIVCLRKSGNIKVGVDRQASPNDLLWSGYGSPPNPW